MQQEQLMTPYDAGYLRVSTETQAEEGYSIGAQTEKLQAYCKVKDFDHLKLYIDGGYSGSHLERPEMQRLIQDIQAGLVRRVMVYKLDRLSRSQKDTLYLIEDVFLPHQVDFISLAENIDTGTPYGRAMIGILSAFAQLERENIFLRTRMGMAERVKQGFWMGGGKPPYGYDYDKAQGILVPNEEAEQVRQMYALYMKGFSPRRIAHIVNLPYERMVLQILKRKSNIGVIVYKGREYPGRHQPLISKELYDMAMERMQQRAITRVDKGQHLLTGLCYCGYCGARMRYQKWGKAGYKLVCYSHDASKPHMVRDAACPNENVWADEIEEVVRKDLHRISADLSSYQQLYAFTDPVLLLDSRIAAETRKLKKLYHLYGAQENDALLETIAESRGALESLQKQREQEQAQHTKATYMQQVYHRTLEIGRSWAQMEIRERQIIVRDCIEKIQITNGHAEIYYRFQITGQEVREGSA